MFSVVLLLISICGICCASKIAIYVADHWCSPLLRISNGIVEFKYWSQNRWIPISWWNPIDSERTVKVFDLVHKNMYDVKYKGPGRTYFKYKESINKTSIAKLNPTALYKRESDLIDRENESIKLVIQ